MSSNLVILKLGGSAINPKSELTKFTNEDKLRELARILNRRLRAGMRFVLIHGGGGFAHRMVRVYGIDRHYTTSDRTFLQGVSLTKLALQQVRNYVFKIFASEGVPIYPLSTDQYVKSDMVSYVKELLDHGYVPLLSGDIVVEGQTVRIVSGDELMYDLARKLRPSYCIFLIDKPGIVDSYGKTISLLKTTFDGLVRAENSHIIDVTGGIVAKLRYAFLISELGVKVYVCGIEDPTRIDLILQGFDIVDKCTMIVHTS